VNCLRRMSTAQPNLFCESSGAKVNRFLAFLDTSGEVIIRKNKGGYKKVLASDY